MKAIASASGGVVFVQDEIDPKTKTISYWEFVEKENATEKVGVFGKRKPKASSGAKGESKVA